MLDTDSALLEMPVAPVADASFAFHYRHMFHTDFALFYVPTASIVAAAFAFA